MSVFFLPPQPSSPEKTQKTIFKQLIEVANFAGDIVHLEVVEPGSSNIESHVYFRTFIDHYSK